MSNLRRAACAIFLSLSFVSLAQAAEEPTVNAIKLYLKNNQDALKRLAADYLSARFDSLDIKYIEPDADDADGGFAVGYQWDAQHSESSFDAETGNVRLRSLDYTLAIDGTYAFSDAANNQDLSTVRASARLAGGDFGKPNHIAKEASDALMSCLSKISDPSDPNDNAAWAAVQAQEDACWAEHGIADIVRGDQRGYYYWLDFHGALEGNQDYSQRHLLAGAVGAFAYQPNAAQARYNILDLPFAGLRKVFGDSRAFVAPFPSIVISVEQIDAKHDEERALLTDDDQYTRGTAEVAWQTRVATIAGRAIRANVSYRYFHEFSAPDAVKAGGLDSFDYVTATLRFPAYSSPAFALGQYEFFVRYTNGQLPFDQRSGAAVEIGIATNIQLLGQLLGR